MNAFNLRSREKSAFPMLRRPFWPAIVVFMLMFLVSASVSQTSAENAALPGAAISLVSISSNGTLGNGASGFPAISADGRIVAFQSSAKNLVPGDTNGKTDIFVHDRETGETTRVSVTSNGTQANDHSSEPAISDDGRFVAFASFAPNLEAASLGPTSANLGKRGPGWDVFVHDRVTGETTMVSVSSEGAPANGRSWLADISGDGRYVGFASHSATLVIPDNNKIKRDPFVHDRVTGATIYVDVDETGENVWSGGSHPVLSADGRYVAFRSRSKELLPGDTNNEFDIFVYDQVSGEMRRVSVSSSGVEGKFESQNADISADGRYVVFDTLSPLVAGDTNGKLDVFLHDRETGETTRISVDSAGNQGNQNSIKPRISADGRYVTFLSSASNLVANDKNGAQDVFIHDRETGQTMRVSEAADGTEAKGLSQSPAISADGRFVAFVSKANNLVSGDTNGKFDIFVSDLNN
jgi:Tol biopolymer transport system component